MIKKYLLNQLTHVSAWMGMAVVLSAMFLPDTVTIAIGVYLILTPDDKLNKIVINLLPKVKQILEK